MSFEDSEEYTRFYEEYDNIIKSPGTFFIMGEHSVIHGQPALYMPVPMYTYVGYNRKESGGIQLEIESIDPHSKIMKTFNWENGQKNRLKSKIWEILDKYNHYNNYKIKIYSDVPGKCGLNSSGSFASALSLAFMSDRHPLIREEVVKWHKKKTLSGLKKDKLFSEVFDLAWIIDDYIQGMSSGIGPYAALVGSPESVPIFYILERGDHIGMNRDNMKYHAFYLNEFDKRLKMNFEECLFALVYSGKESYTREALNEMKKSSKKADNYTKILLENLIDKKIPIEEINAPLGTMLEQLSDNNNNEPYLTNKIQGVLGGFSSIAIGNFMGRPFGDQIENMMTIYQSLLDSMGVSNKDINKICYRFSKRELGAKLTGSGCGGDVVIFSSDSDKKSLIDYIISDMKYTCHYKSWEQESNVMGTHFIK